MTRPEDELIDPEVAAQLDAVDATLAGEPVDPAHAELAELALLLALARPEVDAEFSQELDARVSRRFAQNEAGMPRSRSRSRFLSLPVLGGGLAAGLAAVVVAVVLGGSGGGSPVAHDLSPAASAKLGPTNETMSTPTPESPAASSTANAPRPPANGARIVQSAQLQLTAAPTRIDDVAQEVFDVVGSERGIVRDSSVTATGGADGYAHFNLRIPSGSLSDTMAQLSRLRYAHVASRTDTTEDVSGQFVDAGRRLADARALRTALLTRLANASDANQLASLRAQLGDAEAAITRARTDLAGLNRRVNLSDVSVTLSAGAQAVPNGGSGTSFTLGRAVHDAGRVLTVAAGVALITLAVLVPVGLVAALAWWLWTLARHRRREQALDLA